MKDNRCIDCSEKDNCQDNYISWLFFIIGLIATVAIRAVTVLGHIDPIYGKTAWYIGVVGFLLFFIYKFRVSQARARIIAKRHLVMKVKNKQELTEEDYSLVSSILCALSSNKERINYFFIFVLSGLALILAVYFDFLK